MGPLALNEIVRLDGSCVLVVNGLVDDFSVECFEKGLDHATEGRFRQLIIDLTACRLDSAGLAALIRLKRRANGHAAGIGLVVPDGHVYKMLQVTGLASAYATYRAMDDAFHSPRAAPSLAAWAAAVVAMGPPLASVDDETFPAWAVR